MGRCDFIAMLHRLALAVLSLTGLGEHRVFAALSMSAVTLLSLSFVSNDSTPLPATQIQCSFCSWALSFALCLPSVESPPDVLQPLSFLLRGRFGQSQSSVQLSAMTMRILTLEEPGRGKGICNGSLHTFNDLPLRLDSVPCSLLSVSRLLLSLRDRLFRLISRFQKVRANLEGKWSQ